MRNLFVSSDILGLLSGLGLVVVVVIILLFLVILFVLFVVVFVGGLFVFVIVYLFVYKKGVEFIWFVLIGVVVSVFCLFGIYLLILKVNLNVNVVLIWLSGSLWGRIWD